MVSFSLSRSRVCGALAILAMSSVSAVSAAGNYTEVACTTDPSFNANQCNQCFDGGTLGVGGKVSDLYDDWKNTGSGSMIAYQKDQTWPTMVNLGGSGTAFSQNPADQALFWKYGRDTIWINSKERAGDKEYELAAGKSVRFFEGELGASFSLDRTNVKNGQTVGLMKFPVKFVRVSDDGTESAPATHTECVLFRASVVEAAPVVVTPAPVIPKPQPQAVTHTKTGPEMTILLAIAASGAVALWMVRRKRQA